MRTVLEKQIVQAKDTLARLAPNATASNLAMLETAIRQAEAVLRGEAVLPVSGSRAFLTMTEEDWQHFALEHHVMYWFYREGRQEHFGLTKALEWFRRSVERREEDGFLPADAQQAEPPHFAYEDGVPDYLLFSQAEWREICRKISVEGKLRTQYLQIKEIADRVSDGELDEQWRATWACGGRLPEETELFSDTAKGYIIQAPAQAVAATVELVFPEEALGMQRWRVKDIRLNGADTGDCVVPGELSLPMDAASPVLKVDRLFPVRSGSLYTLLFAINQRRKLEQDIQVVVRYLTADGEDAGNQRFAYNRKAWYAAPAHALHMQCCAICYAVTGDQAYARRAIRFMLLFLDDFAQGALHWMVRSARPEGRDNYGAVQAGRILCSVAMTYAMVRPCMAMAERELFLPLCEFILHDCFDLRDRTILTQERAQRGTGNWQTDMCIGAAMLAAAVEDIPHRRQWILNAEAVLRAQMTFNLNGDGSWPESLRYHHAALEHFCTFARFWEHETGENWFEQNGLSRMFAYTAAVQTPPYRYFGGRISTPPFGDHRLGGGDEYSILGQWIAKTAQTDPQLAGQMWDTWQRAGCPAKRPNGEMVVAELLLINDAPPVSVDTAYRKKNHAFPNAGLYIFRQEAHGVYLAVMASETVIGHGHLDEGSFIYYCGGVPLVMDTGIRGYFDASTQWHLSSLSHACMLFAAQERGAAEGNEINLSAGNYTRRRGWLDTPRTCRVLDEAVDGETPHVALRIEHPEGRGYHIRRIALHDDASVTIQDETFDAQGDVLFSLPMLVKEANVASEGSVQRIRGTGYDGMDLVVEIHTPVRQLRIDEGRATPVHAGDDAGRMLFLRAVARAEDGFRVTLRGVSGGTSTEDPR